MSERICDCEEREIAYTLRRCAGQIARPLGISSKEVRRAEELGLMRFTEWPSGSFVLTDRGRNFLNTLTSDVEG